MVKRKTELSDLSPDEVRELAVEATQLNEIEGRIAATDPSRDDLLREQLVQRAEEQARAGVGDQQGKPTEWVCELCGAEFVLKDAAEAHMVSFHPAAPAPKESKPKPSVVVSGDVDVAVAGSLHAPTQAKTTQSAPKAKTTQSAPKAKTTSGASGTPSTTTGNTTPPSHPS